MELGQARGPPPSICKVILLSEIKEPGILARSYGCFRFHELDRLGRCRGRTKGPALL
jgi:hypothetical protein